MESTKNFPMENPNHEENSCGFDVSKLDFWGKNQLCSSEFPSKSVDSRK